MDKIKKALERLGTKERKALGDLLLRINKGNFAGVDIKKLKGRDFIYRARKRDLRIIFYNDGKQIKVLSLERRSSHTYR